MSGGSNYWPAVHATRDKALQCQLTHFVSLCDVQQATGCSLAADVPRKTADVILRLFHDAPPASTGSARRQIRTRNQNNLEKSSPHPISSRGKSMRHIASMRVSLLTTSVALLAGGLFIAGCHMNERPDDKSAIYKTLDENNLSSITVSQDRRSGVITLTGIVGDPASKPLAENLAAKAAPGYSISDQIQYLPTGIQAMTNVPAATTNLDTRIEDQFKAAIRTHKRLEDQKIQFVATHGTLYLKGSVRTREEKIEAAELARRIPKVQGVVNQLQVQAGRPANNS